MVNKDFSVIREIFHKTIRTKEPKINKDLIQIFKDQTNMKREISFNNQHKKKFLKVLVEF